ncbi:MAG: 16S rRNA (cytosine(1402)-N(4))-methyltransferase RsmH [Synechococcus sp. ELA057]
MESSSVATAGATLAPFRHQPVLAAEVLQAFAALPPRLPDGSAPTLIDCTLGGGGHSALLLHAHPGLRLIGLDQDPTARAAAAEALAPFSDRSQIVATNFADFSPAGPVQGVLADLGVSSPQLDVAARGFSFRADGPLDMRMNPAAGETAGELIDRLSESELADLIYVYGEERLSRRIARRIKAHLAEQGPFSGTAALAYLIAGCHPPAARRGRIHPATRSFQALRIAVNGELAALDRLLQRAPDWLAPGGILAIISFHSLEDRRVKQAFLSDERLERISRKALMAAEAEQELNPRSRSARLRLARRVACASSTN